MPKQEADEKGKLGGLALAGCPVNSPKIAADKIETNPANAAMPSPADDRLQKVEMVKIPEDDLVNWWSMMMAMM